MKNTSTKRILALLLALVMMFGLYPVSAIAGDGDELTDAVVEEQESLAEITTAEDSEEQEQEPEPDEGEDAFPSEEADELPADEEEFAEDAYVLTVEEPEAVEAEAEDVEETPEEAEQLEELEEEEIEIPEPDPYEFYFKETGTLVSVSDVPEDGARSVEYIKDAAKYYDEIAATDVTLGYAVALRVSVTDDDGKATLTFKDVNFDDTTRIWSFTDDGVVDVTATPENGEITAEVNPEEISVLVVGNVEPPRMLRGMALNAEEPAAEEPVVEEPAAEEPVAEEPAAEEPVVEEPVAEEPVVEEPVAEPVVETPVVTEPVVDAPVEEAKASVVEEPVAEPVVEEPVAEPVVETPVVTEPVVDAPIEEAKAPVVEEPVVETPVVTEPVVEDKQAAKEEKKEEKAEEKAEKAEEKAEKKEEKAEEKAEKKAIQLEKKAISAKGSPVALDGKLPVKATVNAQKLRSANGAKGAKGNADKQVELARFDITVVDEKGETILDENGEEWQPAKYEPIEVTITDESFGDGKELTVYYVNEAGEYVEPKPVVSVNNTVTFEAEHFSVYVVVETVVPRLTVKFMNGSTLIDERYVKKEDTVEEIADNIVDPGAGAIPVGQVFKGWTTVQNYTKDTPLLPVDSTDTNANTVRKDVKTRATALNEDDTVIYYAAVFTQYTVTYVDGKGITVGTEVVEIPVRETEATYTVNQGYTTDDAHNFEGWIVIDGQSNIKNYPEGAKTDTITEEVNGQSQTQTITYYENGTNITITGNVKFSVNAPAGYWLIFDENGRGATYNAPQFVKSGDVTHEPELEMKRYGYTFQGWYTGAPAAQYGDPTGTTFAFGNALSETTTIYAKWASAETAKYTVIIWLENLAGDGYDFADAKNLTGTTGDTASSAVTVSGTAGTGASYVTVDGVDYKGALNSQTVAEGSIGDIFKGFHYDHLEANNDDEIVPEGTTVVNVYYDRTVYTLKFYYARSTATSGQYQYTAVARVNNNNGTPTWNTGYSYDEAQTYYRNTNGDRAYYNNGRFYRNTNNNNYVQNGTTIYIRETVTGQNYQVSSNYDAPTAHGNTGTSTGGSWNGSGTTKPGSAFGAEGTETRGSYTYYYKTLTAKYGTYIGDQWPKYNDSDFEIWNGYRQGSWAVMHTSKSYIRDGQGTIKGKITIMDEEILGDLTSETGNYVYANYDTTGRQYDWVYHIYFQNENGEYVLYENVDAISHDSGTNWQTQQHPPAYEGMTEVRRERVGNNREINYYYTRDIKKITYLDGVYVKGDNTSVNGKAPVGELGQVTGIAYGANVSSYGQGGANYFVPTTENVNNASFDPTGFVFSGWYIDSECTHLYTFTTMPEGGITVYAKWVLTQYRVFLHPNAGTWTYVEGDPDTRDSTLTWGSETQQMNFRVSNGEKISAPTGQRKGYEFYGWYTDEGLSHAYASGTVLNESTVTTPYDKTTHMTDPMDKWGCGATTNGDVDRPWVTKEFNLYAKWSAITIGADGIGVIYDDGEGTNAPSDTTLYKDNTAVSAGAAATAPTGKVFDHWVLQTWNGGEYVDTDTTVLPGETFTALKSDAKITKLDAENNDTGVVVAPSAVSEDEHYKYTIQLKAVYRTPEESTPTHIAWYSNYGSENGGKGTLYRYDKKDANDKDILKINEAVDIYAAPSRNGYTFIGWTKTEGGTTADFLIWDGTQYKTPGENGIVATQVAADEKLPYEDLFAVWEPYTYTVHFDANAPTGTTASGTMADQSFEYDEEKALTTNGYSIENYTFLGWATSASGTVAYANAASVKNLPYGEVVDNAEITLYAVWQKNTVQYTVEHYLKGTETKIADDTQTDALNVGDLYTPNKDTLKTATFLETYNGYTFTADSCDPSAAFTVSANGGIIKVYYTLPLTITAATISRPYNGEKLVGSFSYSEDSVLESDKDIIEEAFGDPLEIGPDKTSATNYEADTTGIPSYYDITNNNGSLEITELTGVVVTIVGDRETHVYDGTTYTIGYAVTNISSPLYTIADFVFNGGGIYNPTASLSNVGTVDLILKNPANPNTNPDEAFDLFQNTNPNFDEVTFKTTNGKLEITAREVTVSVEDKTVEYNGSEQYGNTEYTFGNVVSGQTATITYTPSKGTLASETPYDNGEYGEDFAVVDGEGNDVTSNYTLGTQTPGKLTIMQSSAKITVVPGNGSKTYDGNALTKTTHGDFTVTGVPDGFAWSAMADGTVTNVVPGEGEKAINAVISFIIYNSADEDVTDQFANIDKSATGTLEITPATVTLTSGSKSREYNGSALTNEEVEGKNDNGLTVETGWVGSEGA
ncbi:MAG: InlB B-repeat-containing protein, partial [Oscillospiraceae bacterium]|nr:InlB B-repeat-containing protein [Oscillospiraceae bacterium]